jgi:3-phytase
MTSLVNAQNINNLVVKPDLVLTHAKVVDQDDMCIWVHPTDPALSTIITSDKHAGILFVYDINGKALQVVEGVGKPGNIDLRDGFDLNGKKTSIVAFNERNELKVHVYAVDPETGMISRIDNNAIQTGMNYGLTLYHSAKSGKFYAITVPNDTGGEVEQYELAVNAEGKVSGTKVRNWPITESEGCVADDRTGTLYIGEEKVGIWRVGAEPDAPVKGELVHPVGTNGLTADVEGLSLLHGEGDLRYLIASSQGNSRYNVYQLDGTNTFVKSFSVEGATDTDGIDVSPANLGEKFPGGVFALHNGATPPFAIEVCDLRQLGLPLE